MLANFFQQIEANEGTTRSLRAQEQGIGLQHGIQPTVRLIEVS